MPRQHLWGVDALAAAGHAVDVAPFHEPHEREPLDLVSSRSRRVLGISTRRLTRCAGSPRSTRCTARIRPVWPGLRSRADCSPARFVSVVHHPVHSALRRHASARHDVLVCLSESLASELHRKLRRRRAHIVHLPWGPDLSWPLYRSQGEDNGVVSAGKSNRDLAMRGGVYVAGAELQRIADPAELPDRQVLEGGIHGRDPVGAGRGLHQPSLLARAGRAVALGRGELGEIGPPPQLIHDRLDLLPRLGAAGYRLALTRISCQTIIAVLLYSLSLI